ncbi:hypothetical protein [Nonomuraea turcica]|uniref:hypothetical protein n=1 Tax=Nonomuraea sp. G32 TaxID=3067274 RepID=UPI00273A9DD1|nr:hypothetical protein [Nonomuraea sp. G32]MDP4510224.1 hypothetical protein [Nonomuraea sp. G32]
MSFRPIAGAGRAHSTAWSETGVWCETGVPEFLTFLTRRAAHPDARQRQPHRL